MKKAKMFLILLIMTIFMGSCTSTGNQQSKGYTAKVINLNAANAYSHSIMQIIMLKDMLSPYLPDDVEVNWSRVSTSPEVRDGLVSGNIDISTLSSITAITAIENNLPILILSGNIKNRSDIFSKNPDISTIQDLVNASGIYVNSLTSGSALAVHAMSKDEYGDAFKLSDRFIPQDNTVSVQVFASSDDVDCLSIGFPHTEKVMQIPGVHQVVDLTPYIEKYDLANFFVVSEDFYNNNPLLIEAFRKAQEDAVNFMISDVDEAAKLLSQLYSVKSEVILEELGAFAPRLELSGYDNCANLLYELGILTNAPKKLADHPNYADIPKAE